MSNLNSINVTPYDLDYVRGRIEATQEKTNRTQVSIPLPLSKTLCLPVGQSYA